jgi:hypothetical protein
MARVRKLTDEGVARFTEYLKRISSGEAIDPPKHLLSDDDASEALMGTAEVEDQPFASKMEAASYLNARLASLDRAEVDNNVGLWTWLSLFYFDQVCPPGRHGVREPKEIVRHVLGREFRKYYRHLLAGPCRLLQVHQQNARVFLCGELSVHGDFSEQLASRMQFISNPSLIEAVDRIYYDPSSNGTAKPKRGALTRTRPGNLRRFVAVMQQFELTYDMYAMTGEQILALLPGEFDKWRSE